MQQRSNSYAWSGLDRADHLRDNADALARHLAHPDTRIFPLWQNRSLFRDLESRPRAVTLRAEELGLLQRYGSEPIFLGLAKDHACFALDLVDLKDPEDVPCLALRGCFADLRSVGTLLPHEEGAVLAHARALTFWHRRHRYCGRCGAPTRMRRA